MRSSEVTDGAADESTAKKVADIIASQIVNGSIESGDELREVNLAQKMGVSRNSLREAITILSHRGLVVRERNKSVRVRQLTREDVHDLYFMRSLLEGAAMRRLAVDRTRWAEIQSALTRLEALPKGAAWNEIAEADLSFHRAVVDAVGSPRLTQAHKLLTDQTRLVLGPSRRYADRASMIAAHRALFASLRSQDPEAATTALADHLELGATRILDHLASTDSE